MGFSLILKTGIVLSASIALYHALGLFPVHPVHVVPSEAIETETESRSVAEPWPREQSPIVVQVREEEMPRGVREDTEEDPEDRGDPVARAQRDYEERNLRALRNPGIIPE